MTSVAPDPRSTDPRRFASQGKPEARRVTVGEWLHERLSGLFVEARTLRGYREAVVNHLTPAFGHVQLRDLTTQQIRAFSQQKMAPRSEGGGGLHQTTPPTTSIFQSSMGPPRSQRFHISRRRCRVTGSMTPARTRQR